MPHCPFQRCGLTRFCDFQFAQHSPKSPWKWKTGFWFYRPMAYALDNCRKNCPANSWIIRRKLYSILTPSLWLQESVAGLRTIDRRANSSFYPSICGEDLQETAGNWWEDKALILYCLAADAQVAYRRYAKKYSKTRRELLYRNCVSKNLVPM